MCEHCDQLLEKLHKHIRDDGFAVMPVGSRIAARGWAYTIGLVDGYDHPELVIAGLSLEDSVGPLSALARCVVEGERIDTPIQHGLDGVAIGTVQVHQRHLERDLMSVWTWYYESIGRPDLEPRALQIVLPSDGYCYHHQTDQPDLGSPRHVAFDGLSTGKRRTCPDDDAVRRPATRSSRSRPRRPDRIAPAPTMDDLYRHRRSARRRR